MLVTAFLCPQFQDDGSGGLEANNSAISLAGAGRKLALGNTITPGALRHPQGKQERNGTGMITVPYYRKAGTMEACEPEIQQEIKKVREN